MNPADDFRVIRLTDAAGKIRPLQEIEDEVIARALDVCHQNLTKTAAMLQVSRSTVYRKITRKPRE